MEIDYRAVLTDDNTDGADTKKMETTEISIQQILRDLWARKLLIFTTVCVTFAAAGAAAWTLQKSYSAITLIDPVSSSSAGQLGGLGSLTSQFGGLASLAGISGSGDSKKAESIATLQSEHLTETYIETNNLLPLLYAELWDSTLKRWKNSDPKAQPTLWKANQRFRQQIRIVNTDTRSGLVTLTIKWKDPEAAAIWANGLVRLTNEYLREKAIAESENNIAYLLQEASRAERVEARQAIFRIMETEINKAMIARGSEEFAFRVIDPATPPERPSFPQKMEFLVGGLFSGLVLGVILALAANSWSTHKC